MKVLGGGPRPLDFIFDLFFKLSLFLSSFFLLPDLFILERCVLIVEKLLSYETRAICFSNGKELTTGLFQKSRQILEMQNGNFFLI